MAVIDAQAKRSTKVGSAPEAMVQWIESQLVVVDSSDFQMPFLLTGIRQ